MSIKLPGDVKMTFAWCPPGTFIMGSEHPEAVKLDYCKPERPVHRVNLTKGFYMGAHPVTRGQFAAFVAATNYRTEAETGGGGYKWDGKWVLDPSVTWKTPGFTQTDDHPVTVVSWNDALAFSAWLQKVLKRPSGLPSEAEWEYACRAGTTTEFHFGDVINPDLANYDGNYSWNGSPKGKYRQATTAVGSFKPNPWGLFDMHGNVWEWCQDWYAPYSAGDQSDPIQLNKHSDEYRVLRGGCWDYNPVDCRAAFRGWFAPAFRSYRYGFRCVFRLD
jgi:formylglycine-generating enzyme required for sulfatase activity